MVARAGGLLHPDYWIDVCANGIDPFLRTPRDVVRLVNAVASTYPTVRGEVTRLLRSAARVEGDVVTA